MHTRKLAYFLLLLKKRYLIFIVLFIFLQFLFQILILQLHQAKEYQRKDKVLQVLMSFDIFCSFRHFSIKNQACSLESNPESSEVSRSDTHSARSFFSHKSLIDQSKDFLNLQLAMLKYRFFAVKNSLEVSQARKNNTLKLVHGEDHLQFMSGLVWGKKSPTARYMPDFENAGLLHVLVASGFNVALVAGVARLFLAWTPRGVQLVGTLIVIWAYAAFLLFEPPIFRAALMFSLVLLLKSLGTRTKKTRVLLFSVVLILLANRALLESLSLWLSVLATLGIMLFAQRLSFFWREESDKTTGVSGRKTSFFQRGVALFAEEGATSLAAQSLIFPLLVWFFDSANLVSFLANPAMLPWLGTLTQLAGLEFLLTGLDHSWWGRVLLWQSAQATGWFMDLYFSGVAWWQRLSFLNSPAAGDQKLRIIAVWAGFIALLIYHTRIKREKESHFFHEKV